MFFGIDGRSVTDPEQLYKPPHHFLPRYFAYSLLRAAMKFWRMLRSLTHSELATRALEELRSRSFLHSETNQMKCSEIVCKDDDECKNDEADESLELCGGCKHFTISIQKRCENK